MLADELNARARLLFNPPLCARCGHTTNKITTIYKHGSLWCSDECAKRAGDFAHEFGVEILEEDNLATQIDSQNAIMADFLLRFKPDFHILNKEDGVEVMVTAKGFSIKATEENEALARLRALMVLKTMIDCSPDGKVPVDQPDQPDQPDRDCNPPLGVDCKPASPSHIQHTHWLYGEGPQRLLHFKTAILEESRCQECAHRNVCSFEMGKRCVNFDFGNSDGSDCGQCLHRFTRYDKERVPCFLCKDYLYQPTGSPTSSQPADANNSQDTMS